VPAVERVFGERPRVLDDLRVLVGDLKLSSKRANASCG